MRGAVAVDYVVMLGGCAVLAVTAPAEAVSEPWGQWGLAGLVVAYTLWRDAERERRLGAALEAQAKRLSEVQEAHAAFVQETLVKEMGRKSKE